MRRCSHTAAQQRLTCDYESHVEEQVARRQPGKDHQRDGHQQRLVSIASRFHVPLLVRLVPLYPRPRPRKVARIEAHSVVVVTQGNAAVPLGRPPAPQLRGRGAEAGDARGLGRTGQSPADQEEEEGVEEEGEEVAGVGQRGDEWDGFHGPGTGSD